MILISHRGNINGRVEDLENSPNYIDIAINYGYDVEVDIRYVNETFYLGHDYHKYEVSFSWLFERINNLWIHCKDINSVVFFKNCNDNFNYFWHESDKLTLTSKQFLWVYPGNQPVFKSISVLPEIFNDDLTQCLGVCSDFIKKYEKK